MQDIATKHNWSEIAFAVKYTGNETQLNNIMRIWPNHRIFSRDFSLTEIDKNNTFFIRWFSPKDEPRLCGHATLATSYTIFNKNLYGHSAQKIQLIFCDGTIEASFDADTNLTSITMPEKQVYQCTISKVDLSMALGIHHNTIEDSWADDTICCAVVNNEAIVNSCIPDYNFIQSNILLRAVAITSKSSDNGRTDFCSRYFAPSVGINEDPVCGSLHCRLAVYWSAKLNKNNMIAKQLSHRGGLLHINYSKNKVILSGECRTVSKSVI